jgi:thiol-disulfide isomerase/thioredoxin
MRNVKTIWFLILTVFFFINANPLVKTEQEKKEFYKSVYLLYTQKEYVKAMELLDKGLKKYGSINELLHLKYNILMSQKKYAEAVQFIDDEIKKSGESEELLSAKYNVYYSQKNYKEALDTALRKDKIAKIKSPWDCMNLVHLYILLRDKDDALDWLQEAASRGFISYRLLQDKKYALIQKDDRFLQVIENIKLNIGLGEPAKDFTAILFSGEKFTLSTQRGKVVLIVFWATWCEPCKKDMISLIEYYRKFHGKGFEIVSVSLDSDEKQLKEYLKQQELPWKNLYTGLEWKDPTALIYRINSIPSSWLVDKKGILRSFDIKGKELRDAISTLIVE